MGTIRKECGDLRAVDATVNQRICSDAMTPRVQSSIIRPRADNGWQTEQVRPHVLVDFVALAGSATSARAQ